MSSIFEPDLIISIAKSAEPTLAAGRKLEKDWRDSVSDIFVAKLAKRRLTIIAGKATCQNLQEKAAFCP